jgi:methylmalonyl-CoA mutase, N-terminal domain
VQADPFKEFIAQNEYIIPPRPLLKLFVDTVEYCGKVAPNWNPVSISGYHIREAGSSAAQELAFTLANGIAYIDACIQRGMHVDAFAPRFSFFFDFHNDWLEEIAKIRSARRMWARIIKERFGSNKPRSQHMRTHIQTAGITLTQEQPLNNIARVAIQALGAVLAGTQSLHTNSYDEQLNLPSEEAVKVALRTQQIIAHETGLKDVVDPFAGSYAMERMTSDIEAEASALIEEIDNMGGMLAAIESGWAKQQIRQNSRDIQEQIENGERVIIGQNMYNDEEPADTQFEVRPEVQEEQIAFLSSIKTKRSSKQVRTQLRELEKAARRGENCMPFIRNAAESYATLQEIFDVFRELFGTYRPDKIL